MKKYGNSFLIFIILLLFSNPAAAVSEGDKQNFWQENDDILTYLEAVSKIKDNLLFLPTDISRKKIIDDTLKSYLNVIDSFSEYLTSEELSQFIASQKKNYVGIGMEIEKNVKGEIICLPYSDSPAELAGIKFGDILEEIDGQPVTGKSIFAVASMARGEKGTNVLLKIRSKAVERKHITVTRIKIRSESVNLKRFSDIAKIRIISFSRDTQRELKSILNDLKPPEPIIIDIRGNPGGDLYAAIDSAMLFLHENKKIVSIRNQKNEITVYKNFTKPLNIISPIYIWQDEKTASAAEVFIAALTQNYRAVSIGKITYGKGIKQDIIELSDGSALVLTTGYLETPNGTVYHQKGLSPMYPLPEDSPEIYEYMKKVKALIKFSK